MRTVWLVRHGERQDLVDESWAESTDRPHDPPLTERGSDQASQTAKVVAQCDFDRVFTSPFLRSVATAHEIAERSGLPLHVEAGLEEWLNPDWFDQHPELLPRSVLSRRFSTVSDSHTPLVEPQFPETEREVHQRVARTCQQLVSEYAGDIVIVGHWATVVGAIVELTEAWPIDSVGYCSISEMESEKDGWQLIRYNRTDHIE